MPSGKNQERSQNDFTLFSQSCSPGVVQGGAAGHKTRSLHLQHHTFVCSAAKAYGLQIFICFMCWVYYWIQSKHKSLGILLFFFLLIHFTVCEAFWMFPWTNRAVLFPDDLKCTIVAKVWGCCNLEKIIYMEMGKKKSKKHLSYCSPCSAVFKNGFVSSGWKNVNNILVFFCFSFPFLWKL